MKKRQYIKYENYEKNKREYGHLVTWALWNKKINEIDYYDLKADSKLRKELIIANSKDEYKMKGLDEILHGDVVILNSNITDTIIRGVTPHKLLKTLSNYKGESDNSIRYNKLVELAKNDDDYVFMNMYAQAGQGKVKGSGYGNGFMKHKVFEGAYMTDFVKFTEDTGKIIPAGIPESDTKHERITSRLKIENVETQAKGLKTELDSLGVKPKVILLIHYSLRDDHIKKAICDELGYSPHFESLYNYANRFPKSQKEIPGMIKDISDNIEKHFPELF